MRNFNFEPIIVLIIFILIPLANYVLERMRRRFEQPKRTEPRMPDMGSRRQAPDPTRPSPACCGQENRRQERLAPPATNLPVDSGSRPSRA